MKNKNAIFFYCLIILTLNISGQNNTFSPYSRFGIGELSQNTFAHNSGMGGAFIAHKPDSTMPIFINAGNPAAYSLIRLTSLEVGGSFLSSTFSSNNTTSLKKWGANFAYGALGFPVGRTGGACFGIMPYSQVGYDTENKAEAEGIGSITYKYNGSGGLNKAFLGYGVMPFSKSLIKFRTRRLYIPDSLRVLTASKYKVREFGNKLLSDLALGVNGNYIFGSIYNTSRVIYPNSLLYNNTYREKSVSLGDFTGSFGLQTALTIDSVQDSKRRRDQIAKVMAELKALSIYSEAELAAKQDSLAKTTRIYKRAFKEKVKITFGYFSTLNNPMSVSYNNAAYSYIVNGFGEEIVRDTVYYKIDQKSKMRLPLEQGFGLGFKKGERFNFVTDFAITDWSAFKFVDDAGDLIKNYRIAAGVNFVPEKYAAGRGAFGRKINYRLGFSYQTGYIRVQNAVVSNYFVSAGIGLPVGIGRLSSMVNISGQYGRTGTNDPLLLKENYWRINFGFTFSDKWFQKFRYD